MSNHKTTRNYAYQQQLDTFNTSVSKCIAQGVNITKEAMTHSLTEPFFSSFIPGGIGTAASFPFWSLRKLDQTGALAPMWRGLKNGSNMALASPSTLFRGIFGVLTMKAPILTCQIGISNALSRYKTGQDQTLSFQLFSKLFAGSVSSLFFTPLEQTLLKAQRHEIPFWRAAKHIYHNNGPMRLVRGLGPICGREAGFVTLMLFAQDLIQQKIASMTSNDSVMKITSAFLTGLLICAATQPLDMIAATMQSNTQTNTFMKATRSIVNFGILKNLAIPMSQASSVVQFMKAHPDLAFRKIPSGISLKDYARLIKYFYPGVGFRIFQITVLAGVTFNARNHYMHVMGLDAPKTSTVLKDAARGERTLEHPAPANGS